MNEPQKGMQEMKTLSKFSREKWMSSLTKSELERIKINNAAKEARIKWQKRTRLQVHNLAGRVKVPVGLIWRFEHGLSMPSPKQAVRINKILGEQVYPESE
jgi:ribosome-binding protein aMBF1 (putative translation factor)